jgi:PAS domain S-box-containing protein
MVAKPSDAPHDRAERKERFVPEEPQRQPEAAQPVRARATADERFQSLLEKLPVAAYSCDCEGLITYFNQHAVNLWGRVPRLRDPMDRFCGSFRLFSADGAPIDHQQCWMAMALQTGGGFNGQEIIVERPNGERLTVLAHANPIHDDLGAICGAVNILVDISDRNRAAEAQAFLASIVESSEDAIISKSLEGRILSWNAGAERLFGYTAQEAIGSPITLIIPSEALDEEVSILTRLRRGERIAAYETVRVSKQGRRLDISLTISPVRDGSGRLIGASKVARDISARREAERQLLAAKNALGHQLADLRRLNDMSRRLSTTLELRPILEETLRAAAAIDGADFGMLSLWDSKQGCLRVEASLGFADASIESIQGMPQRGSACGQCLEQGSRVVIEDVEIDPAAVDYRETALQMGYRAVHSTPLIARSGKVIGVLSTHFRQPHRPSDRATHLIDLCARQAVDFIENARVYARLQAADQHKDEFLATLSHELRNPMGPLRNAVEILRGSAMQSEEGQRALDVIDRQSQQMTRLIDDLLDSARIASNKLELRRDRVELTDIIRLAVETSQPLIDANDHELAVEVPTKPTYLDGDPTRLAQVVSNLLNNAAKYMHAGGHIWLTAEQQGSEAIIRVRDAGIGIADDVLPSIFDMFAQAEHSLDRAQGGLGVGLSLAKRLVEMHGGTIAAQSDGPGEGSEFTVRLPVIQGPDTSDVSTGQEAPRATSASLRVLVADDNRDAADMLATLLERAGYEVLTVDDGAEALNAVEVDRPDVVLMDIGMPGMNGYDAAKIIRGQAWGKDIVLIATTGWGQDTDIQRSHDAGFDHHLVKPIDSMALIELLASLKCTGNRPKPSRHGLDTVSLRGE